MEGLQLWNLNQGYLMKQPRNFLWLWAFGSSTGNNFGESHLSPSQNLLDKRETMQDWR